MPRYNIALFIERIISVHCITASMVKWPTNQLYSLVGIVITRADLGHKLYLFMLFVNGLGVVSISVFPIVNHPLPTTLGQNKPRPQKSSRHNYPPGDKTKSANRNGSLPLTKMITTLLNWNHHQFWGHELFFFSHRNRKRTENKSARGTCESPWSTALADIW